MLERDAELDCVASPVSWATYGLAIVWVAALSVPKLLLCLPHNIRQTKLQGFCHRPNYVERSHYFVSLYPADGRAVNVGSLGDGLMGEPKGFTTLPQDGADRFRQFRGFCQHLAKLWLHWMPDDVHLCTTDHRIPFQPKRPKPPPELSNPWL